MSPRASRPHERSNEILRFIPADNAELKVNNSAGLVAFNSYNIGHEHWLLGRHQHALAAFVAAQAVYDRLLERGDADTQTRDFAGRNLLYLSRAYPADRRELALAAGRRADSIFQSLVHEYPDRFDIAWNLCNVHDQFGLLFTSTEKWNEAILAFERARRTLKDLARRHGKLVSRMAVIQARIAEVDINLLNAYASDPVRYAANCRTLNAEAYEICEKLSLVGPLSWNSRVAYAITTFALADYQVEDGHLADIELIKKAEALWKAVGRESPNNPMVDGALVVVRRRLAEELADRGQRDEAARGRASRSIPLWANRK